MGTARQPFFFEKKNQKTFARLGKFHASVT
jgi:hypothetical protein